MSEFVAVKLCHRCSQQSPQLVLAVVELALHGSWLCPFGVKECGELERATPEELEELVDAPSRKNPLAN